MDWISPPHMQKESKHHGGAYVPAPDSDDTPMRVAHFRRLS